MTGPTQTQGSFVAADDPFVATADARIKDMGFQSPEPHRWVLTTHECCFESDTATSFEAMWVQFQEDEPAIKVRTGHSARRIAFPHNGQWAIVHGDKRVVIKMKVDKRKAIRLGTFLTGEDFARFKQWLGHRYSRPALPDPISDFLGRRGINDAMSDLLDELEETEQVLITGHEDFDESDPIIGIRLAVLLKPGTELGGAHDDRRERWRQQVIALNWADEDGDEAGVALESLTFLPAENLLYADFVKYGVMDFEFVSHRHVIGAETPSPTSAASGSLPSQSGPVLDPSTRQGRTNEKSRWHRILRRLGLS